MVVGSTGFGVGVTDTVPESEDESVLSVKASGAVTKALSWLPVSGDAGWCEAGEADFVELASADDAPPTVPCEAHPESAVEASTTAMSPMRNPVVTHAL
jgi:hypothetical protein